MCTIVCRKAKSPLKAKNGSPPATESPSKPSVVKKKGGRLMIESDDEEENTSMEVEIVSEKKVLVSTCVNSEKYQ